MMLGGCPTGDTKDPAFCTAPLWDAALEVLAKIDVRSIDAAIQHAQSSVETFKEFSEVFAVEEDADVTKTVERLTTGLAKLVARAQVTKIEGTILYISKTAKDTISQWQQMNGQKALLKKIEGGQGMMHPKIWKLLDDGVNFR